MTGWTDAQQSHVHEIGFFFCMPVVRWMLYPCGHLLRKVWPLGSLVCDVFATFSNNTPDPGHNVEKCPYGVLGQVRYLIVWIPDLCLLRYFYLMYTYAKFDQNIPCGLRVTQWAFSPKELDRPKWCSAAHCHLFAHFSQKEHGRTDGQTRILTQGSCNT